MLKLVIAAIAALLIVSPQVARSETPVRHRVPALSNRHIHRYVAHHRRHRRVHRVYPY